MRRNKQEIFSGFVFFVPSVVKYCQIGDNE